MVLDGTINSIDTDHKTHQKRYLIDSKFKTLRLLRAAHYSIQLIEIKQDEPDRCGNDEA